MKQQKELLKVDIKEVSEKQAEPPLFKWLHNLEGMEKGEKIRALLAHVEKIRDGKSLDWKGVQKAELQDSFTMMVISEKKLEQLKDLLEKERKWTVREDITKFQAYRRKALNDYFFS